MAATATSSLEYALNLARRLLFATLMTAFVAGPFAFAQTGDDFVQTALPLAATMIALPLRASLTQRAAIVVSVITISSASAAIATSHLPTSQIVALSALGATTCLFPPRGLSLSATVLLLATASGWFTPTSWFHVWCAWLGGLLLTPLLQYFFARAVDHVATPVRRRAAALLYAGAAMLLVYTAFSAYFFHVYWTIYSVDPSSFGIPEGVSIATPLDFALFAGTVGLQGEPIYLTPISSGARTAVLLQMLTSVLATTIYIGILLSALLDREGS